MKKTASLADYNTENKHVLEETADTKTSATRKTKPEEDKLNQRVTSYLTKAEKEAWVKLLDGRPEAKVIRKLILKHMDEPQGTA
tara:strand:- start:60 stop:311 length:252 start_codon:yes stop_codon:yes gene_type:complete